MWIWPNFSLNSIKKSPAKLSQDLVWNKKKCAFQSDKLRHKFNPSNRIYSEDSTPRPTLLPYRVSHWASLVKFSHAKSAGGRTKSNAPLRPNFIYRRRSIMSIHNAIIEITKRKINKNHELSLDLWSIALTIYWRSRLLFKFHFIRFWNNDRSQQPKYLIYDID